MYKRIGGKYLWLIFTMLILLVSSAACTAPGKQPPQKVALLDDITIEGKFQYKDYPWSISESDFFTKSKMDAKTSLVSQKGKLEIFSDKKTTTYTEPNVSMFPVFFFSDGKLYKVQIQGVFADEKMFSAAAKELKSVFDNDLNIKPTIGDTEFLNEISPDNGAGLGSIYWTGNDESSVAISTFGYSKTTSGSNSDNGNYNISIVINAPSARDRS